MLTLGYRSIVAVPGYQDASECSQGYYYPESFAQAIGHKVCKEHHLDTDYCVTVPYLMDDSNIKTEGGREAALVGLIEGRHPIPVPEYLLPRRVTREYGYHNALYSRAEAKASAYAKQHQNETVVLFITGLTVAALGAISGFHKADSTVVVASYDRDTKTYIAIHVD